MIPNIEKITGLIIAGGRGQRMGGKDKGLIEWQHRPLVEHVLQRLEPQVHQLFVNANRNQQRYAEYGHRVISDQWQDYRGPLAGILAGLKQSETEWLLCAPCDAPLLPTDLNQRLCAAVNDHNTQIAFVDDGDRQQPLFCLLHKNLVGPLEAFIANGDRGVFYWMKQLNPARANYADQAAAFANFNYPEDLK